MEITGIRFESLVFLSAWSGMWKVWMLDAVVNFSLVNFCCVL